MKTLRAWREEKGVTQERLAELTGISQALLSKYERGDVQPGVDAALAIEKATKNGVPVEVWAKKGKAA